MRDLSPFVRPNFFTGKLLSADDLRAEQEYHRGKQRLLNRALHGWGIVDGLAISVHGDELVVRPGLAIDCAGNEVILAQEERATLPSVIGKLYVTIRYHETPIDPVPMSQTGAGVAYARMLEGACIELASESPEAGHNGMARGTPGCGQPHALSLGTVTRSHKGWRCDPAKPARKGR